MRPVLELLLEALPLAKRRAQIGDDAGQAGDDEQEQHDAAGRDDRHVDLAAGHPLDDEHRRRHQRGDRQQRDAPARQPDLGHLDRLRDTGHRGVERRRPPQDGTDQPPGVNNVPRRVAVAQRNQRIREVRGEERRQRADDERERHLAAAGGQEDADEDAEQQDVEHRIGERHRDLGSGRTRIIDDRRHQECPAHEADPDRHDERVEHTSPIAAGNAATNHPHHRGRDQAHAAEIEGVRDRWEWLDAVHPIEHDPRPVADGGEREAGGEEQPRPAVVRPMDRDAGEHGDGRQHLGHLVRDVLELAAREQEVAGHEHGPEHEAEQRQSSRPAPKGRPPVPVR